MSCVNAKLSHFSNISTILALDGAKSVMSSAYINIPIVNLILTLCTVYHIIINKGIDLQIHVSCGFEK